MDAQFLEVRQKREADNDDNRSFPSQSEKLNNIKAGGDIFNMAHDDIMCGI